MGDTFFHCGEKENIYSISCQYEVEKNLALEMKATTELKKKNKTNSLKPWWAIF